MVLHLSHEELLLVHVLHVSKLLLVHAMPFVDSFFVFLRLTSRLVKVRTGILVHHCPEKKVNNETNIPHPLR